MAPKTPGTGCMAILRTSRLAGALILLLLQIATTFPARADITDYEFRLVEGQKPHLGATTIVVELLRRATGDRIGDAVLFAQRLDMEPDGMATMTSALELLPSAEPGTYRFRTNLTMAGGWRLSLAAKIQGERETLVNRLVLEVAP